MSLEILAGVIAGLVFLYLVLRLANLKKQLADREPLYVDTQGIISNPPNFIDVIQNRTINFQIDKTVIKIDQINFVAGINTIKRIADLFTMLKKLFDQQNKNKIDEFKNNIYKLAVYRELIKQLYNLSKCHVKKRRKYKKQLYSYFEKDFEKLLLIFEQVLDYWGCLGECLSFLARGTTRQQTTGVKPGQSLRSTGTGGKTVIIPRFELCTN
jgi:hypothetical protein